MKDKIDNSNDNDTDAYIVYEDVEYIDNKGKIIGYEKERKQNQKINQKAN